MIFRTNSLFEESLFQVSAVTTDIYIDNLSLCHNSLDCWSGCWCFRVSKFHSVWVFVVFLFWLDSFWLFWLSGFLHRPEGVLLFRTLQNPFFFFFLECFLLPVKTWKLVIAWVKYFVNLYIPSILLKHLNPFSSVIPLWNEFMKETQRYLILPTHDPGLV